MSIQHTVLVGYANGDVHSMQVMKDQQASQMATEEADQIGVLTNAGFRTIVASVWTKKETKTAGLLYAAVWNENQITVLLRFGDRIASSHELYRALAADRIPPLTAVELLKFCRQSKIV